MSGCPSTQRATSWALALLLSAALGGCTPAPAPETAKPRAESASPAAGWTTETLGRMTWGVPANPTSRKHLENSPSSKGQVTTTNFKFGPNHSLHLSRSEMKPVPTLAELAARLERRAKAGAQGAKVDHSVSYVDVGGIQFLDTVSVFGADRAKGVMTFHSTAVVDGVLYQSHLVCLFNNGNRSDCQRTVDAHTQSRSVDPPTPSAKTEAASPTPTPTNAPQ